MNTYYTTYVGSHIADLSEHPTPRARMGLLQGRPRGRIQATFMTPEQAPLASAALRSPPNLRMGEFHPTSLLVGEISDPIHYKFPPSGISALFNLIFGIPLIG